MSLSTHVLDTALGRPAAGVVVVLRDAGGSVLCEQRTNVDGRVAGLPAPCVGELSLTFHIAAYFGASDRPCFYPEVCIRFTVTHPDEHHHVPLLISPFSYSTYRGS